MLPLHLTKFAGHGAAEYATFCRDRGQWFRDHGIHPGDWPSVSAVLRASERAHGIDPSYALARAKLRGEQVRLAGGLTQTES